MWGSVVVGVTAVLAALWVPIGLHFWKAWRLRGVPLSLAICGLVGFQVYLNSGTWLFLGNDPLWVASVVAGVNLLILVNFYACLKWQNRRFMGTRRKSQKISLQPPFR